MTKIPQPSGERPGGHTDAAWRADPCKGEAAPSQPRILRPRGTGHFEMAMAYWHQVIAPRVRREIAP